MKPILACLFVSLVTSSFVLAQSSDAPLPRMRGTDAYLSDCLVVSPNAASQLSEWGCNAIRMVIDANQDVRPTESDPLAPYQEDLQKLRDFLPTAHDHGIQVIVSLGNVYGRNSGQFWSEGDPGAKARAVVANFWTAFATKFKSESQIVAYDLLNQPNDPNLHSTLWAGQILPAAVSAVRAVNPDIWLIVEPGAFGAPFGFRDFKPIDDKRTIYGMRAFSPSEYTFQGISAQARNMRGKVSYPGTGKGVVYNRQALVEALKPAIDFAETNRVRMVVLEFAVARWAPGADRWTQDMISIFEEQKWDWFYHSFFGWNGMNPTYEANDPESGIAFGGKQTAQFKVLTDAWKKNSP